MEGQREKERETNRDKRAGTEATERDTVEDKETYTAWHRVQESERLRVKLTIKSRMRERERERHTEG